MYVLGTTFLKFRQVLNLQLPVLDPSLYIHRFAAKVCCLAHQLSVAMLVTWRRRCHGSLTCPPHGWRCWQLNLGSAAHQVAMTALRLVARMRRDWIQTGRR